MSPNFARILVSPLPISRCLHSGTLTSQYLINYNHLRGSKQADIKLNGAQNKKFKAWTKSIEERFHSLYPDVIHTLASEASMQWNNQELGIWYTKILTHNLASVVVGNRNGILVPLAFQQLSKTATTPADELDKAHLLGWGVELIRASNILYTNLVQNVSTWPEKYEINNYQAFNDVFLLQNGFHIILNNFFKSDPNYLLYLDAFLMAARSSAIGRLLQFEDHPSKRQGNEIHSYDRYKQLVRHTVSNTNFILPITLAMHMRGLHDRKIQNKARTIFELVGYFTRLSRDYNRHYRTGSTYSDIRFGRMTYLNVVAKQRNSEVINQYYGQGDDKESIEKVLECYEKLKLKRTIEKQMDLTRQELINSIQQISKIDKLGFSQEFVFQVVELMEEQDIV